MGTINSEAVEYKELGKMQRVALFLMSVGPEASSHILGKFDDKEVEAVCREISKMKIVDEDLKQEAIKEFSAIIGESFGAVVGGMDFAKKALEIDRGNEGCEEMMGRIVPGGSTADLIQLVMDMEPMQIYNVLKNEQSQTLAFLVAHLPPEKAVQVAKMLPQETREEILEYVGSMEKVPIEMLAKLAKSIKGRFSRGEKYTMQDAGGVAMVADMLNMMDKEVSRGLLARLEETNPDLGQAINKKMFSFEDIVKLSTEDMQRVTREIETNDLVISLKAASKEVQEVIMGSVSKRAAESLKEELDMLGPLKVKIVEEAQERIIHVIKRLEDEGAIDLDQGGGDVIG